MNRNIRFLLGLMASVFMAVILASCVESNVPLSEPKAECFDNSLAGVWHAD